MSDLDKLMAKMNGNKKPTEQPVEQPAPIPAPAEIPAEKPVEQPTPAPAEQPAPAEKVAPAPVPAPAEIPDDMDDEDVEQEQPVTEEIEQVPAKQEDEQHSIEQEVAVLQNVGIFRREMILIEKEKVDVLKVMAQTLLDIKKKLLGEEDAPKK